MGCDARHVVLGQAAPLPPLSPPSGPKFPALCSWPGRVKVAAGVTACGVGALLLWVLLDVICSCRWDGREAGALGKRGEASALPAHRRHSRCSRSTLPTGAGRGRRAATWPRPPGLWLPGSRTPEKPGVQWGGPWLAPTLVQEQPQWAPHVSGTWWVPGCSLLSSP